MTCTHPLNPPPYSVWRGKLISLFFLPYYQGKSIVIRCISIASPSLLKQGGGREGVGTLNQTF